MAALLRNVFHQTTLEHAQEAMSKALDALEDKWPRAAAVARYAEDDVQAYFTFPTTLWKLDEEVTCVARCSDSQSAHRVVERLTASCLCWMHTDRVYRRSCAHRRRNTTAVRWTRTRREGELALSDGARSATQASLTSGAVHRILGTIRSGFCK